MIFLLIFLLNNLASVNNISPELDFNLSSISQLGKNYGKVVAASCGYTLHGSGDEYQNCSEINCGGTIISAPGVSQCGGACQPNNPNICSSFCLTGITPNVSYTGYQLMVNNIHMFTNISGRPTPNYSLGTCTGGVPAGYERRCEVNRISSDGTNTGTWTENYDINKTTWVNQLAKTYPYSENIQIRCGYINISNNIYAAQTGWYRADAATIHPNYGLLCTNSNGCGQTATSTYDVFGVCPAIPPAVTPCNATNACGENYTGYICDGVCNAGGGPNAIHNSCIRDFRPTSDNIAPNGSVEFSWETTNASSTARCSFVDLTAPVPRPIPGLQDLDVSTDKIRITNIQTTTRFCLVCKFYSLIDPSLLIGEAAKHQWIRVQRVGEN